MKRFRTSKTSAFRIGMLMLVILNQLACNPSNKPPSDPVTVQHLDPKEVQGFMSALKKPFEVNPNLLSKNSLGLVTVASGSGNYQVSDGWYSGNSGVSAALARRSNENLPAFIWITAEWCGWCKKFDREYADSDEMNDFIETVVAIKAEPEDNEAAEALASQLGTNGYPAFFVVPAGTNKAIEVSPWQTTPQGFVNGINRLIGR